VPAVVGRSTHWLTGLWSLGIAGLAACVVLELTGTGIAPEVTAAAPATGLPEAPPEPREFQPPPRREFNEISARPLFFPSRRPFVPPDAPAATQAAVPPPIGVELIGVLLTEQERAALVQPQGEAEAHWLHEGQTVAGWSVEEIAADHVTLRDGDRLELVKLRADRAPDPPKAKHKPGLPKSATARAAGPAPTSKR
jgi:hypothetical protein